MPQEAIGVTDMAAGAGVVEYRTRAWAGFVDDFNRADANPIDGSWDPMPSVVALELKIVGQQVAGDTGGGGSAASRITQRFPADVEMEVTVATLPVNVGERIEGILRGVNAEHATNLGGYRPRVVKAASGYDYIVQHRNPNGGAITALATVNAGLAAGDRLRFRAVGPVVSIWRFTGGSWSQVVSHDTSSDALRFVGPGSAGLILNGAAWRVDDVAVTPLVGAEQYVVPEGLRVRSWRGSAATPRMVPPISAAGFDCATLFNRVGSGVIVALRRLTFQDEMQTATTNMRGVALEKITTNPTGGNLMTPMPFDTAQSHAALVEFRAAAATDGAAVDMAAASGSRAWRLLRDRLADLDASRAGQARIPDSPLIPLVAENDPIYLREGEGVVVTNVDAALSGTASNHNQVVNAMWEEFTLP
jgi:hypothetical protein